MNKRKVRSKVREGGARKEPTEGAASYTSLLHGHEWDGHPMCKAELACSMFSQRKEQKHDRTRCQLMSHTREQQGTGASSPWDVTSKMCAWPRDAICQMAAATLS